MCGTAARRPVCRSSVSLTTPLRGHGCQNKLRPPRQLPRPPLGVAANLLGCPTTLTSATHTPGRAPRGSPLCFANQMTGRSTINLKQNKPSPPRSRTRRARESAQDPGLRACAHGQPRPATGVAGPRRAKSLRIRPARRAKRRPPPGPQPLWGKPLVQRCVSKAALH
jgi:hypothetical protein